MSFLAESLSFTFKMMKAHDDEDSSHNLIHSFRSHIREHFVLEWKSTLKLVD